MEIDHVYICTKTPDKAVALLTGFGLDEGEPNIHPGQGTANHRFFFRNAMLEILYVRDEAEMHAERTRVLAIAEQFSDPECSPVGIILRPSEDEDSLAPFQAQEYFPLYLPPGMHMDIGVNSFKHEPKYVFMGFARNRNRHYDAHHLVCDKAGKRVEIGTITKYVLHQKFPETSDPARKVSAIPYFSIVTDSENFLEIEFDDAINGLHRDFRPDIPLILTW